MPEEGLQPLPHTQQCPELTPLRRRRRTFCAGQDLKGWLDNARNPDVPPAQDAVLKNPHGFGSVSRRMMRKPLIAALNGPALGGGAEMLVKCDIVVGYEKALVSFPEVHRGECDHMGWVYAWRVAVARDGRVSVGTPSEI